MIGIKTIMNNGVAFYLASRYFTYFIQFVTSLIIAAELGPYYLGIWGFVLLILQYFQQFHLGIGNSFNVLYVQHRNDVRKCDNYIGNSIVLVTCLSAFVLLFYFYYLFYGIEIFEKYHVDKYLVWICLVAIMQYFVQFFINVFRVKNQLIRISFCQSIIVLLNFLCLFFFKGETLIEFLIAGYVVGNMLCILIALTSGDIPGFSKICIKIDYQLEIIKKGLFLFIYNSCFLFIIISIRTIISHYYPVEEFGIFTFSFTLAHAFLLVLEAMSFIVFPKIISKMSSDNIVEVKDALITLRITYITSSHIMIYVAMICFPLIIFFLPKYSDAITSLNLIALTILMNVNSTGYNELLIANNKEKKMALFSSFALLLNCLIALFLVLLLRVSFSYVIIATLITYYLYTLMIVFDGCKHLGDKKIVEVIVELMPLRLLIPYIIAFVITLLQWESYIWIPIVFLILLNSKQIRKIMDVTKLLLFRPEVVNLK